MRGEIMDPGSLQEPAAEFQNPRTRPAMIR